MAGADYKSCDVCGCKTFYDANLDYDFDKYNEKTGLHRTGDHMALCEECSKTYELKAIEKDTSDEKESQEAE